MLVWQANSCDIAGTNRSVSLSVWTVAQSKMVSVVVLAKRSAIKFAGPISALKSNGKQFNVATVAGY